MNGFSNQRQGSTESVRPTESVATEGRPNAASHVPKVSVIMPAYNVAGKIVDTIRLTTKHLKQNGYRYEMVIVDDGSTDDTFTEATRLRDPHIRVVGYERNRGKGYAVRFGSRLVSGDFVVVMDSDGNITPDLIVRYIGALKDHDIAIASKWHPESRVSTPLMRRILSHSFHVLVVLLTGVRVSDTQCGFKVFRSGAFAKLISLLAVKHYAFDVEVLTVARLMNLRIAELPVRLRLSSHFSAKKVVRVLVDLLGISYRLHVIHWYQKNLKNLNATYRPIIRW